MQGQTLEMVGVWLADGPAFTHGQLYVAVSRWQNDSNCVFNDWIMQSETAWRCHLCNQEDGSDFSWEASYQERGLQGGSTSQAYPPPRSSWAWHQSCDHRSPNRPVCRLWLHWHLWRHQWGGRGRWAQPPKAPKTRQKSAPSSHPSAQSVGASPLQRYPCCSSNCQGSRGIWVKILDRF